MTYATHEVFAYHSNRIGSNYFAILLIADANEELRHCMSCAFPQNGTMGITWQLSNYPIIGNRETIKSPHGIDKTNKKP